MEHTPAEEIRRRKTCRVSDIVPDGETCNFQYETETKQQSPVWVHPGETPPVKFKRSKSVAKQTVTCLFSQSVPVATIPLEDRKTVNSDWYMRSLPAQGLRELCKRRPRLGTPDLLLHQTNASDHPAAATRSRRPGRKQLECDHSSLYSLDLAPSDRFLFSFIKKQLREYSSRAPLTFELTTRPYTHTTWSDVMDNWFYRMTECINPEGGVIDELD